MAWKTEFRKEVLKFLESLPSEQKNQIKEKINEFLDSLEGQKRVNLDIKKLRGDWEGFMRLRIGKIRVIFKIYKDEKIVFFYEADFRGDVYK
jgi:mRNA interferase RelE/StbE